MSFASLCFLLECVVSEPIKWDRDTVCTYLLVCTGVVCGYLCVSIVLSIMAAGRVVLHFPI